MSSFPDEHAQHVSHGLVEHSIYRRTHFSRTFRENSRLEALASIRSLDKYMIAVAVFEFIRTFAYRIIYQSLALESALNVIFGRSCDLMVTFLVALTSSVEIPITDNAAQVVCCTHA